MKRISKTATTMMTIGVWVAAFGALAGTAYELKRPLPASAIVQAAPTSRELPNVVLTPIASTEESIVHLAPFTIYGQAPQRHVAVQKPQQHCVWRTLDIGSGAVQVCD